MKKKNPNVRERELAEAWSNLKKQNAKDLERGAKAKAAKVKTKALSKIPKLLIPEDRNPKNYASVDSGKGSTALPEKKQYTGQNVLGISQMAKSNAVPVFSKEEIVDINRMRRN